MDKIVKNLDLRRLLFITAGFLALMWFLTLRHTWEAYSKYAEIAVKAQESEQAPKRLRELKTESKYLELSVGNFFVKKGINHEKFLFNVISDFCKKNNLILASFPTATKVKKKDFFIYTNEVTIKGNFVDLIQLLNFLETTPNIGRISSVHYKKRKDLTTKKEELFMTMYIELLDK